MSGHPTNSRQSEWLWQKFFWPWERLAQCESVALRIPEWTGQFKSSPDVIPSGLGPLCQPLHLVLCIKQGNHTRAEGKMKKCQAALFLPPKSQKPHLSGWVTVYIEDTGNKQNGNKAYLCLDSELSLGAGGRLECISGGLPVFSYFSTG